VNDVIISATLKGVFKEISNDGVQFTLVTRGGRGNTNLDEFTVLAYGNSAKFLQQHATSGSRVVAQGRLSSEKLDTDVYHTAVTVNRVLSVSESGNGIDYSRAVISGLATCEGVRSVGANDNKLASFNIANVRKYVSKDGEERSYKTYLGASVWGDSAKKLEDDGLVPVTDGNIVVEGVLKPRTYENRDGVLVGKVDIWVDDISFIYANQTPEPKKRPTQEDSSTQAESPSRKRKVEDTSVKKDMDSDPF
jgi:single-stranded DNA-binding protein